VAIFSDMDWVILIGVGVFLFFGKDNGQIIRQIGHWYGRMVRMKNEAMAEVTDAAQLPRTVFNRPASLRETFLSSEYFGGTTSGSGIPAAVTVAPVVTEKPSNEPFPYSSYVGPGTWSMTLSATPPEEEHRP
jgi:hypothetical protein